MNISESITGVMLDCGSTEYASNKEISVSHLN